MQKLPIKRTVEGLLRLQDTGTSATLLGIGPMSSNLLQAAFELGRDDDFPLMFIASRNQVDCDDLGGGYVNGWDQKRFSADIAAIAQKVGFDGLYYLCRDHGGPWQRDEERNAHLPEDEAMELARKSYLADMLNGFDLLMIDPTKDPFEIGKVIPLDVVLRRTVDLIEWCEKERVARGLPEIGYEVGTEETNGGLTSTDKYHTFIERLKDELVARGLPMPTFIVGQTGTLTRLTKQVGHYDFEAAYSLAKMARSYGVGLKEHNADYLDDVTLLEHTPANVTASNVAPQYGTEETRAYLKLC
ncbi:MAG: class II D-tagatose-bisphosphate aldolase non-catalytic subunit, partial [Lancefieldella rimae]